MKKSKSFRLTTILCALFTTGAIVAPTGAAHAAQGGCQPTVYFELDANGFVTAYPAADCADNGQYERISILAVLRVDGEPTGISRPTSYTGQVRDGGVYSGTGISARNPPGTNAFCTTVTVEWTYYPSTYVMTNKGRTCAYY